MLRVQGNKVLCCLAHVSLFWFSHGLSNQLRPVEQQQRGPAWPQARHQTHRAAAAARAVALRGTFSSSSSSGGSGRLPALRLAAPVPPGLYTAARLSMHSDRSSSRRLRGRRHLASALADSSGSRVPGMLPYPRDPVGVQGYLRDAESSAPAPYVIPVWFVVVVDPANHQATNISSRQVAQQLGLLNAAYATGLPRSGSVITEAGGGGGGGDGGGSVKTESGGGGGGGNLRLGNATTKPMVASARGRAQMRARRRPLSSSSSSSSRGSSSSSGGGQLWRFLLMGIRYISSSSPMCTGSSTEQRIKQDWRQKLVKEGGTVEDKTLVVYVSDITAASCKGHVAGYSVVFGYGTTPYDLVFWKQHNMQHRDGVVIDPGYLLHAGMQQAGAGMLHGAGSGAQLVHEVGHWMGLVHTWDGGCQASDAETDQVGDTPAEAHPTKWGVDMRDASSGCKFRDSCGALQGADIYENYMTYYNLACARSFTAGQQARMLYFFKAVRYNRR